MYILGINGGLRQGYQDVSAVLVKDGGIIAAVEEERLSRVKSSAGRLPYLSVLEVLNIGGITIEQVDELAFHGSTWNGFDDKLEKYFNRNFGYCPPVKKHHHHDCHAASAFFASPFQNALIISMDGSGDGISLQISVGKGSEISTIYRAERPNSLGIYYTMITQYCGFIKDRDEYKLMGLSSYGNRNAFTFDWLIDFKDGELILDQDYLVEILPGQPAPHRDEMMYNTKFIEKFDQPGRIPKSPISDFYKDIAASAQYHFEKLLLKIAEYFVQQTGLRNVCLAGGSALNCVANQQLMNADFVEGIYIQPASSDAGISLGAAWLSALEHGQQPKAPSDTYLGSRYSNQEIETILDACHLSYKKLDDPAMTAADFIAQNKVIGWFQNAMEFGPRALGNRSILANPCHREIQNIVNKKIKLREGFRPFCPSVLEEDTTLYFEGKQTVSPYMTITYNANEFAQKNIPGVVHVDQTARIQTVNATDNPLYYSLLRYLKLKIGHGVVLNTSFNLSHEPIVCSPRDAIATFFSSGLDALIMGAYLIEK